VIVARKYWARSEKYLASGGFCAVGKLFGTRPGDRFLETWFALLANRKDQFTIFPFPELTLLGHNVQKKFSGHRNSGKY
jgi:hypothetical protein